MKKILGLGLISLVGIAGLVGFYVWFAGSKTEIVSQNENGSEVAVATSTSNNDKPLIVKLPKYTGQAINVFGTDPIIATLPAKAVELKKTQLADLASLLSKNPDDFNAWMSVGNFKKFFNNFIGARDAWEYAKLVAPNQPLTYLNLANLYTYYLNDQVRAEANYLAAADLDVNNAHGSLYATANYYRDFGQVKNALKYYKLVLETSPKDSAVKMEISRLEAN